MVYVTGEGDFVYLSVEESLMCFDTVCGKYIRKYGPACQNAAFYMAVLFMFDKTQNDIVMIVKSHYKQ